MRRSSDDTFIGVGRRLEIIFSITALMSSSSAAAEGLQNRQPFSIVKSRNDPSLGRGTSSPTQKLQLTIEEEPAASSTLEERTVPPITPKERGEGETVRFIYP